MRAVTVIPGTAGSAKLDEVPEPDAALGSVDHLICYAVKANSNRAILKVLAAAGAGFDIVSGGELYRALKAGYTGKDIVFSGVGKTEREMEEALRADVLLVNVESEQEVHGLDDVAGRIGTGAGER